MDCLLQHYIHWDIFLSMNMKNKLLKFFICIPNLFLQDIMESCKFQKLNLEEEIRMKITNIQSIINFRRKF